MVTQKLQKRTQNRKLVRVFTLSPAKTVGILRFGNLQFRAALGKEGVRARKREGDGATPRGLWPAIRVLYRPDRMIRPRTQLPASPLRESAGWCDAPGDRNYNRPVTLPYGASAERMWRGDDLYDAIIVLDYNVRRRSAGRGSAIFVHAARAGFAPTEGCVALSLEHLLRLLAALPRGAVFALGGNVKPAVRSQSVSRHVNHMRQYSACCCPGASR